MEHKDYTHNVAVLNDSFDQLEIQRKAYADAKNDIERITALEKIVTYSSLVTMTASWTLAQIQYPEPAT